MKDIKEKPAGQVPKSNVAGEIPKAALKKAWTEAKEKSRTKLREKHLHCVGVQEERRAAGVSGDD